jgi:hypothetical protein
MNRFGSFPTMVELTIIKFDHDPYYNPPVCHVSNIYGHLGWREQFGTLNGPRKIFQFTNQQNILTSDDVLSERYRTWSLCSLTSSS